MDSSVFNSIKDEKQRAVARFNRFRALSRLRQIVKVFLVLGLISWSSPRIPAVLKSAVTEFLNFDCVFDHLAVFIIGNAIVVTLFLLSRHEGGGDVSGESDRYYDEYSRYRAQSESQGTEEIEVEKQIVIYEPLQEEERDLPQLEEVDAVIRKEVKRMEKFRRTESDKLKGEMELRPAAELRRSRTGKIAPKAWKAAELDMLSDLEFHQAMEEYLEDRWCRRMMAADRKADDDKRQLMVVE